jgi:hypothetical protein
MARSGQETWYECAGYSDQLTEELVQCPANEAEPYSVCQTKGSFNRQFRRWRCPFCATMAGSTVTARNASEQERIDLASGEWHVKDAERKRRSKKARKAAKEAASSASAVATGDVEGHDVSLVATWVSSHLAKTRAPASLAGLAKELGTPLHVVKAAVHHHEFWPDDSRRFVIGESDVRRPADVAKTSDSAAAVARRQLEKAVKSSGSAAKALLTAAGVLQHNKKLLKKSTATEHATSSSSTATEHATFSSPPDPAAIDRATDVSRVHQALLQSISTDDVSRLPLTGLPMSTSKLQASASEDGYLLGDNDLEKIVALLLWMAQDFQSNIHIDEIHYAALEVVIKHVDDATGGTFGSLQHASVAKLSKLIDIMMLHKDGSPKDANATLTFMRRSAKIREELRATSSDWTTEGVESSDNATERVELDEDEVSWCYQRFGRILLTDDLLPHQKQDKRYRLRNNFEGDTYLSTFQRSFIDSMLRKFLGDKKVAFLIWQHGIPSIADMGHATERPGRGHATERPDRVLDMVMLAHGLDECLQWYISLANDIVVHQTQEGFAAQLSASSLDEQERQRQQTRREALQKAQDALRLGAALAKERDDRKRSYDDMSDAEQKILESYETGRTKKAKQRSTTPKLKPFRGKLQIND